MRDDKNVRLSRAVSDPRAAYLDGQVDVLNCGGGPSFRSDMSSHEVQSANSVTTRRPPAAIVRFVVHGTIAWLYVHALWMSGSVDWDSIDFPTIKEVRKYMVYMLTLWTLVSNGTVRYVTRVNPLIIHKHCIFYLTYSFTVSYILLTDIVNNELLIKKKITFINFYIHIYI